jgi:hypothetical protein
MKLRHSANLTVACACALLGCAAPNTPVEDPATKDTPKPEISNTEDPPPAIPVDGLRVGILTELPKETQFRSTIPLPLAPNPGGSAVIVTPPPVPKPSVPPGS